MRPGLAVLQEIAATLSDDVWTVAPETDQSGLAHSLTLSHPLRVRKVSDRSFSVTGTPTDCVIMAARHIVPDGIDLVLSGVNAGQNIGDHVTYSGTVSAAMEGTLLGIRSIALSQAFSYDGKRKVLWDTVKTLAPDLLKRLISLDMPTDTLLNVNFPNCAADECQGERIATQGRFSHGLGIEERHDGRGMSYYWLKFIGEPPEPQEGSDIDALREHEVAITPVKLDLTNHEFMSDLKAALGK